ncbi:hypothetical protein [Plantibacter cousiniae (nom. nud.)]|uniref:DUF3592 domain-containing protein n=1 Tax=Plantibacter cousiniae (nom. nud.) TaxID=199709 RepID=A0ABY1LKV2_9MICO|nr:hypothetical protein [Plantibacter cousiniae]SKC41123.1 hypothetical protein SAMN06295973_0688 [Plantibacter cousiniae]
MTTIDRSFIRRVVRARTVLVVTLAFLTAVPAYIAFGNVGGLASDLTARYTTTTGQVVDEGTERVLEGSRRSKHWEEYRTVTVDYDVPGTAGSDEIRSDTIQVGETLDVWVRDQTGKVALEQPAGPDFWQWFWAVTMSLLTALLAWSLVIAVRNSIRLAAFRPDGRQPDFVFALGGVSTTTTGKDGKKRLLEFTGLIESSADGARVGERGQLTAPAKHTPVVPVPPARILGYRISSGAVDGIVVLYLPEADTWWVATLSFPANLQMAPTAG